MFNKHIPSKGLYERNRILCIKSLVNKNKENCQLKLLSSCQLQQLPLYHNLPQKNSSCTEKEFSSIMPAKSKMNRKQSKNEWFIWPLWSTCSTINKTFPHHVQVIDITKIKISIVSKAYLYQHHYIILTA